LRSGTWGAAWLAPPLHKGSSPTSILVTHGELAMKTFKNLTLALALAVSATAAGCAADAPDMGDQGGGGGGGDTSGSDDAPHSMDASGRYEVTSTFDIASNMPGTVGDVTNTIIDMTDGATDPADWILDQVIDQTSGTIHSLLNGAKPFIAGYLNDQLLDIAPDFVTTIVQLGNDFGQIARNFGLNETLDVTGAGMSYTSTVTAVGVKFKVDSTETDLAFADYNMDNVVATGVGTQLDVTGKLDIAEHKMPLSYGKILRLGVDNVLIPMVDSSATNLQDLLGHLVDCQAVGAYIDDAVYNQFGVSVGSGPYAAACTAGLAAGANLIYSKLDAIDGSALEFDLVGTAKAVDSNNDSHADRIQTGVWTGTLSYAGTPAPLSTATFIGSRM
jgi:hypothetical protein